MKNALPKLTELLTFMFAFEPAHIAGKTGGCEKVLNREIYSHSGIDGGGIPNCRNTRDVTHCTLNFFRHLEAPPIRCTERHDEPPRFFLMTYSSTSPPPGATADRRLKSSGRSATRWLRL